MRKGWALTGLREYTKAEETFEYILKMNANCRETKDELILMRCSALIDMGFDKQTSIRASKSYGSIREAIDGLLSQKVSNNRVYNNSDYNVYNNCNNNGFNDINDCNNNNESQLLENGERYADKARNWAQLAGTVTKKVSKVETCLKPTNIWNYNGIRVENVNVDNKKALMKKFSAFGKVKGIEQIRNSKTSVWIYFDNPLSPVQAIAQLNLTINTDINYYQKGSALPLRMFFAPTNDQTSLKFSRPKQPEDNKGECYYWRTTSCSLDNKCPLLHIPVNKHIDAQVWMKTKDGKHI